MGSTARDTAITLARTVTGLALGLATVTLIARLLGATGQGAYSLCVLLSTMGFNLLNLGLPQGSIFVAARAPERRAAVFAASLRWLAGAAAVAMVVALALTHAVTAFAAVPAAAIGWGIAAVPLFFVNQHLNAFLQSANRFGATNLHLLAFQLCLLAGVLIWVGAAGGGVPEAVGAYTMAQLISLVVTAWAAGRLGWRWFAGGGGHWRASLHFGARQHLATIFAQLNTRLDLIFLGFLRPLQEVGGYALAATLIEKVWTIPFAVTLVLFPKLSAIGDPDTHTGLAAAAARQVLIVAGGLAFGLWLAIWAWGSLWFGDEFASLPRLVALLGPGIVAGSHAKVTGSAIASKGYPGRNSLTAGAGTLCNIILNAALVPRYGPSGAAIATSTVYVIDAALKLAVFARLAQVPATAAILPRRADLARWREARRRLTRG